MSKFKVGDIVIGNEFNMYGITGRDVKVRVVEVVDENTIKVSRLDHEYDKFLVYISYFDIVEEKEYCETILDKIRSVEPPAFVWSEKIEDPAIPNSEAKQAQRFNKGKIELSLCPTNAIAAISTIFMINSQKYGGKYQNHNWRIGAPQSQYIDCALRHLLKHASGQELDDGEKGCGAPHLWLALTNLAMATEMMIEKPELDDRFVSPIDFSIFEKYLPKKD